MPASLAPYGLNSVIGWVLSTLGAIALALVLSRLSRVFPGGGGPYAYTHAAFDPLAALLVAWGYRICAWVGNAAIATGAALVALAGAISGFGALNGWILIRGEVPCTMARNGAFPRAFARTSSRNAPVTALVFSGLLVTILVILNANNSSVRVFTFMVLLATSAALVMYLVCSLARLKPRWQGRLGTARLRAAGMSIDTMDLLIGTAAVMDDAPPVTRNARHFSKVPGLQVVEYRTRPAVSIPRMPATGSRLRPASRQRTAGTAAR